MVCDTLWTRHDFSALTIWQLLDGRQEGTAFSLWENSLERFKKVYLTPSRVEFTAISHANTRIKRFI